MKRLICCCNAYQRKEESKDIKPSKLKIFTYSNLARVFGYTFVLKLMENKLNGVIKEYTGNTDMINEIPEIKEIYDDEVLHEQEMLELIDEKRLQYVSSMVLGMNDAIVEFTGAKGGVFKKQFFEMAAISLGVASISFIIGIVLKKIIGIEF